MIANILIALSPPVAAYLWTQIFLFAGGSDFHTSFYWSMGALSLVLVLAGLYHGALTVVIGGFVWLFVVWNVLYQPFAVLF